MTDNEIIKALNYCCGNIKNNDDECQEDMCYQVCMPESRDEGIRWCRQWLMKDALDLITRQKAEIENFKVENQSLRGAANSLKMHYEEAQAEIERLNKVYQANQQLINALNKSYFLAKAEAYKEFAERLKENINKRFVEDNTMIYRCVHIKDIDNLLKEMAGEDNREDKK